MSLSEEFIIKKRKRVYYGLFILLFISYWLMRGNNWQGSTELHTIMEVIATLLAFIVGILALLRFYTKENNTFLFIGSGFIGTGLLDGYHAVVTSTFFIHYFPSVPSHLIPWSWIASRLFLSVLMLISWWAWKREGRLGEKGIISERLVFAGVGALTLISFLFFAFAPLPRAYYPELFFGRPEEFVPALFFLLALIGYLRKGWWKNSAFEHWLVLSLIVGFMGQAMFMSFSYHLFDFEFDAAHLLKKVSYICVLIGLLTNFYYLFRKSEKQTAELKQEISERKKSETALKKTKERFEDIARSSGYWIWEVDAQGRYTYASGKVVDILGFETEEIIGKTPFDFMDAADVELVSKIFTDIVAEKKPIKDLENWNICKDGTRVCLLTNGLPLIDEQGTLQGYRGTDKDITRRKEMEFALWESGNLLKTVLDHIPLRIFWKDKNYKYLGANKLFAEDAGFDSGEQMIGKDDFEMPWKDIAHLYREDDKKTLVDGKVKLNFEEPYLDDKGEKRWVRTSKVPLRDKDGNIFAVLGMAEDITNEKKAELDLKEYNEALKRSNRELQDFAYIASHDLQEPLRKVMAFGDRLKSKFGTELGEQGNDYLNRMHNAATRMRALIDDLLAYSRVATKAKPFVPVELNTVIKNILSDLEVRIKESGARVEVDDLPAIEADKMQMRQLFQNLISNALKFHKVDSPPQIKISVVKEKGGHQYIGRDYYCILVQDNGIGFEEKYHDKIFSPFQRLHGRTEYEGSGMGLAICKKIVERHGGRISASSEPGKGSVFKVCLPKP